MTPAPQLRLPILLDMSQAGGPIAIDKPAGLASTGRTLEDTDCAQYRLAAQLGRPVWALHQLDRETSGVNLFVAKKSLVAPWQDALGRGLKRYVAICHGEPAFDQRQVDAPIGGSRQATGWVWEVDPNGRPARSTVLVLARANGFAIVHVDIETGRTHQVRIHLAHLGHPLVGERRYRQPPCTRHPRHALHAALIRLPGPAATIEVHSPLPPDLTTLLSTLGLPTPT